MRNKLLISVVAILPVVLAGCAAAPSYQASTIDRSQGAIVRTWASGTFAFFTYTQIEKVDGLPLSTWSQDYPGSLLDPGVRLLSVAGTYVGAFGQMETGRAELTATLEPGHAYQVKAERGEQRMTLWVEDQETHAAASERKTTSTTSWIKWLP